MLFCQTAVLGLNADRAGLEQIRELAQVKKTNDR
jgi:hypothetical protein